MKKAYAANLVLLLFASISGTAAAQASVDWQAIEKIAPNQRIRVETDKPTTCYFERADESWLICFLPRAAPGIDRTKAPSIEFPRAAVKSVQLDREDDSAGFRSFIMAAGAGGGWDSSRSPTAFAGVKIGGQITLNLQYDRMQGHSGFTTEGAGVLPLFRVPAFARYASPETKENPKERFLRLYAEPGVGYRAGGGKFGGYTSAGMLFLLFPDDRQQPYVEVHRRFPFSDPLQGDTRISVGVMISVCGQCGFD
ncbi:MAG TPA: hypothetical protein VHX60_00870 [Acidobacteriaceae bacterium]|jgi:hypothetical protein|nr:hypothetical protein [Acidobacteriaceae bacterium]